MSEDLIRELEAHGAILRGHFEYTSGRHGDTYIEKFALLQWPDLVAKLCGPIAQKLLGRANLVAGPTTGGVILSYELARQLQLRSIIAERKERGEGREFKRGFKVGSGDRVVVIDDILTTGGSIREVIKAVSERGAAVVGVGVLVDRTGGKTDFEVPFVSALTIDIPSYTPTDCPQCRAGEPLTTT